MSDLFHPAGCGIGSNAVRRRHGCQIGGKWAAIGLPTQVAHIALPSRATPAALPWASPDEDRAMRSSALPLALVLAAVLASPAPAQLPFGTPPLPESGVRRQCNKDYVASLEAQAKAVAKMRTAGPEFVGEICSVIEQGSALFGGELPDGMRRQLKDLLG